VGERKEALAYRTMPQTNSAEEGETGRAAQF
jgi:hypothetical protein